MIFLWITSFGNGTCCGWIADVYLCSFSLFHDVSAAFFPVRLGSIPSPALQTSLFEVPVLPVLHPVHRSTPRWPFPSIQTNIYIRSAHFIPFNPTIFHLPIHLAHFLYIHLCLVREVVILSLNSEGWWFLSVFLVVGCVFDSSHVAKVMVKIIRENLYGRCYPES